MANIAKSNEAYRLGDKSRNQVRKPIISILLYAAICNLVFYAATREYEQKQPIGLLLVGMVFIPVIITIFGGLPLNFIHKETRK